MSADEINRFAVLPAENTPAHIAVVKLYSARADAEAFARQVNGTVMVALDVDALINFQRREAMLSEFGAR